MKTDHQVCLPCRKVEAAVTPPNAAPAEGVALPLGHEGEPGADGMARLQHDVVTLPPNQQALGLSEAITEGLARVDKLIAQTEVEQAIVKDNLARLNALLERGKAAS